MNSHEYALRNLEEPSLAEALRMCKDRDEMLLLIQCLRSKQAYYYALKNASSPFFKSRDYWLESAARWSSWYLDELRQLEALK